MLRKAGIAKLYVAGLVTNGGVASTLRDAHVREIDAVLLSDGCAAFSPKVHEIAVEALRPVAPAATVADAMTEIGGTSPFISMNAGS
jgi:nicotinamidase-related amidase